MSILQGHLNTGKMKTSGKQNLTQQLKSMKMMICLGQKGRLQVKIDTIEVQQQKHKQKRG